MNGVATVRSAAERALVGAGWFLAAMLIALLPFGALTLMYWSRFGETPRLLYLIGTGQLLVVTVGVSAQAVLDGGRLASRPGLPSWLRALIGSFATLVGLALVAAALWYGSLLSPTESDTGAIRSVTLDEAGRIVQGSLVVFIIAVLAGAIFAAIKEATSNA